LALAEMAHASGRRGLWNERLRRPAYRILARARVGGKANMPPPRQAASAADRAICARIFTAIDSDRCDRRPRNFEGRGPVGDRRDDARRQRPILSQSLPSLRERRRALQF
jgi:hypothetical protein